MSKLGIVIAFTLLPLLCLGQQPAIVVESFEYVWPKHQSAYTGRVNLLYDKDIQQAVELSFKNAIQKKWNVEPSGLKLTSKPLPLLLKTPKFNTKLKSRQAGTWYLFLQIIDDPTTLYYNGSGGFGTRLQARCKMIDQKDSVVLERNVSIVLNIENSPATEVQLTKLLAHPRHVVKAFEVLAGWLFSADDAKQKALWLKPALAYTEKQLPSEPISTLQYNAVNSTLCLLQPTFCVRSLPKSTEKKGSSNKVAGNAAGSVLTALTGIGTTKVKTYKYEADFPFRIDDSIVYNCRIPFTETITAEREREVTRNSDGSKSYSTMTSSDQLSERRPDTVSECLVIKEDDTIARFRINYLRGLNDSNSYKKMWDGADTATIIPLKEEWKNSTRQDDILLQIKTANDSIYMKSSMEQTVKEFSINQKTVLVIYGANVPVRGFLFHPLSKSDLELFTLLASLPYNYFNVSPN
ncbi:MAG: hypothetical protein ACXVLT_05005 [Flavisolibacter sp.]